MSETENLTQLGEKSETPQSPGVAVLETIANVNFSFPYSVRLTCPEFTSLCPKTGQPDFAHIVIDYIPDKRLVESKSLKLFMQSFRNHGSFHEECSAVIARRLFLATQPHWLRVGAFWYPRGGIPIDVFVELGDINKHKCYVHPLDVPSYRGRG